MVSRATPLTQVSSGITAEEAASEAIRDYCGWHIAPCLTETITLDGNGHHKIFLPTRHLVEVDALTIDGKKIAPEEYRFSQAGWIALKNSCFPRAERAVTVTIKHGFSHAPAVSAVAEAIIARAKMSPTGNIISQRAGTQSVSFASSGGQVIGFGLLQAEKELLNPYRVEWGPQ